MEKLEEIKERLKGLTPEELEELKAFLSTEETKTDDEVSSAETEAEVDDKTDEVKESEETQNAESEEAESDAVNETETPAEEKAEDVAEETKTEEDSTEAEEVAGENAPQQEPVAAAPNFDDIPPMQKGYETSEVDKVDENLVTDETGEKIPVDYEQIVEGLNAKIAALEAENTSLKNKVDGAFGYSAKPTMPAKVNRLYDDCEDVHIHK